MTSSTGLITSIWGRGEYPTAPVDIADTVELYARESGRNGTVHFVPTAIEGHTITAGTWFARFTLRAMDPRMKSYHEGQAPEPPVEDVWFHEALDDGSYRPLDILQMGASGVREFLDRGNSWSGRGEYTSLHDQLAKVREGNAEGKVKFKQEQKELNRHEQREKRRHRFKIPFLPVEIDLKSRIAHTKE